MKLIYYLIKHSIQLTLHIFHISPCSGPKTVHFWAPMFKWGLVIAGLADINRPVEKVSLFQSTGNINNEQHINLFSFFSFFLALATTGLIWARYSTQIVPINYNLMAVNLFVGASGIYQLVRIYLHSRNSPSV